MLTYAPNTNTAITFAGLANAAGRESRYIDNSSTRYDDFVLTLWIKITGGATNMTIGSDKVFYVYFAGANSLGALDYPATGTDAAITIYPSTSSYSLAGPFVINVVQTLAVLQKTVSVGQFFGGVVPPYWNFTVYNACSLALTPTETDHGHSYCGVYYVGT